MGQRDGVSARLAYPVRIFRAIFAPFILYFEILDMSRETVTLETCAKARRLPGRGNADTEIINSTPADHTVGGDRSKAELHMVHVNAEGHETAVLAIRLDPGSHENPFFSQLPAMVSYRDIKPVKDVKMNMDLILASTGHFSDFWSYRGSLTSPPCREGIRWFVARSLVFTSTQQMQDILKVSTFSAREEQEIWLHEVNGA